MRLERTSRDSVGVAKGSSNSWVANLAHQSRTIAITSDFRVDGAKSPEIKSERRGFGLRHRSPESQIAGDFPSHP